MLIAKMPIAKKKHVALPSEMKNEQFNVFQNKGLNEVGHYAFKVCIKP